MSDITLTKVAEPATPAANKVVLYVDTADRRIKTKDDLGVVSSPVAGYEKNILINGGFDFIQRCAAALTNITGPSATNRIYSADRWGFTVGNVTTPQFQQVDTSGALEAGITARYYARYKQLTNAAKIALTQVVLARDTSPVVGRVVRLQCKMRYSVGSNRTMRLGLLNNSGTVDAPTAAWVTAFNGASTDPTFGASLALITPSLVEGTGATIVGSAASCPITTTWTRFSATFLVPTTCKNLMPVIFSDTVGAASDDFLFTEICLFDGADIQDWVPTPTALELVRCLRFYCKTFPIATVPAQNAGVTGGLRDGVAIAGAVATSSVIRWQFPVQMVKLPTVVFFNPSAANAFLRNVPAATDATATSSANPSTDSTDVNATGLAAWVAGQEIKVHATADAEL